MHVEVVTRRLLLKSGAAIGVALCAAPGARADAGGHKLVIVILRGAMDGLAMLQKQDDPHIRAHREGLLDTGAIPLADGFALHSALPQLAQSYRAGEAAFLPASAGPYRERSHFEAQDLLESGSVSQATRDGWLNRALESGPGGLSAVSIGPVQPLILRGAATAVSSWSPPVLPEASGDTLSRLMELYEGDRLLQPALAAAVQADMTAGEKTMATGGRGGVVQQYPLLMRAAGRMLATPDGPDIAVVSLEGWDTHAGQNAALAQRFRALDQALADLRNELGAAWGRTAVVIVSEFGRTVRENGAGGTDHGTAGLMTLAGGAVKGGAIRGDWPGLAPAALFEDRDLRPTVDVRSVFKGLLRDHLGWDARRLDTRVFPDSGSAPPLAGLVRTA